jgi:rfaE bifunctional protein nucleotidyltransferase chain/domain
MASVPLVRVVQAHGCFDLLHLGHIRHLQAAKAAGDYLVVTVTADRFVRKGPGRPAFTACERMEALRGLGCVDEVQLSDSPTAADAIRRIQPAAFVKGSDYSDTSLDAGELAALQEVGGRLVITQTEKWSSTALLQPKPDVSDEIRDYISGLKVSADEVIGWLEKARALKVVVIGDAILDDYHYVEVLGKAGKEPILAAQFKRAEQFIGGVEAVANHTRACTDHVMSWSGPAVVKRRFIETYPFQKLFEVYEMDEAAAARAGDALATRVAMTDADLVIVADYGHGFVTPFLLERIQQDARFLAVNVQANAGNHGYHTISKYRRANFLSVSERELRLDARDQNTDVRELMRRAADPRVATMLVTRGEKGCLAHDALDPDIFAEAPALSVKTVDRVGAGDAVFAVTACCDAVGMPLELIAFVASVVGTLAVGIVGNARYIERDALHREIRRWLR